MYTTEKDIYFHNCDPAGVLFFAELFSITHSVYEEMLRTNAESDYFDHPEFAFPIVHASADYSYPVRAGERVSVQLNVSSVKSSSFELKFKVYKNDTLCASVETIHVCIAKKNGKKAPLPDEFIEILENLT